jgi:guanylate cyclase
MNLAEPWDRLNELIDRIARIGDAEHDDHDLRVRKHALALTAAGLVPTALIWIVIGIIIGRPLLAAASTYFAAALLVALLVMAQTKAFMPVVRGMLIMGFAYVALGHIALGGLVAGGGSLVWGIVAPASAVLYLDSRSSLSWLGVYGGMVVAAVVLDPLVVEMVPASWPTAPLWLFLYNLLGPAFIVLLLIRYVDGQRLSAQQETRRLLHDMLPAAIADRLARGETMIAESHESVSILFADVVDFTGFAERVPPRELLLTLNQMFSIFDGIAVRHGVEKIKTMGDSYVAVAGAPLSREDHAQAAVAMAIEMQRAVSRLGGLRRRGLQMRIGIASGPVTAGVIGRSKGAYDVWGDAVNVASRMESYGVPGMIQVAGSTRALLNDSLPWAERQLKVKGKGLMTTFVLNPERVVLARPVSTPMTASAMGGAALEEVPALAGSNA